MLARGDRDDRPREEQAGDQDEDARRQPDQRADKQDRNRQVGHLLRFHQSPPKRSPGVARAATGRNE